MARSEIKPIKWGTEPARIDSSIGTVGVRSAAAVASAREAGLPIFAGTMRERVGIERYSSGNPSIPNKEQYIPRIEITVFLRDSRKT